jgi:hypothetical protein
MTNQTLSPAAQQVFWEFNRAASGKPDDWHYLPAIAAALRAAADQVQMNTPLGDTDADAGVFAAHHAIRAHFLAIAAELEGNA